MRQLIPMPVSDRIEAYLAAQAHYDRFRRYIENHEPIRTNEEMAALQAKLEEVAKELATALALLVLTAPLPATLFAHSPALNPDLFR